MCHRIRCSSSVESIHEMYILLKTKKSYEWKKDSMQFFNVDEEEIEKTSEHIEWDANAAEKGGYEHFMLKEMYEQPKAILDTFSPRIKGNDIVIEELGMSDEEIKAIRKIMIVACGSAYHAGVTAKYVMEGMARIPVETDLASEFRYRDPIMEDGTLVVIISQSGETADSLAALREAKEKGAKVLGIVNVVGSSIAREADNVMYTWASTGNCSCDNKSILQSIDRFVFTGHEICICEREISQRMEMRGLY